MKEIASISPATRKEDILAIASVHPMREGALRKIFGKIRRELGFIEELVERKELVRTEYQGNSFYLRRPEKLNKIGTK